MKRFLSIGIVCTLVVLSCSKKETAPGTDPDNPNGQEVLDKLFNDIQGRWDFKAPAVLKRKAATTGRRAPRFLIKSRFIETNVQKKQSSGGFIEFLNDSTYVIYDTEENSFTGKFEVKDGTTISLKDFGSIKNIKFSNDAISFIISYDSAGKTIEITANQAAPVATDDRSRKLCFNWLLLKEKDGKTTYEDGYDYYNESTGEYETRPFDKLTIQFSKSGTYLVQISNKGALLEAEVANWKWHYKNADKLVYWWGDELTQAEEDENNITIISNTGSTLELHDFYSDDDGIIDEYDYVLSRIN
jgi:hypothetical protein